MSSYNRVILLGNLTRDPELSYIPSGAAKCEFSIAVNRKWKDSAGEQKDEVSFLDCIAWAKTGEVVAQYFAKGKPILLEGRLQQERWDDKTTGQKRSRVRVVVERFCFVGGRDEAQVPQGASGESEEASF